jgi:hypothetical protein
VASYEAYGEHEELADPEQAYAEDFADEADDALDVTNGSDHTLPKDNSGIP